MTGYLRIPESVQSLEMDDAVLVFTIGRIHLVADSAAEIWRALDGSTTTEDVVKLLSDRHGRSSQVSADIRRFVSELIDSGLVDESDEPAGNGPSVPAHVAWTTDADRVVVADLRSGARTTLTTTASLIWELIVAGVSRAELIREVNREFPDAPPHVEREVDGLIDSLLDQALLQRSLGEQGARGTR